MKRELSLLAIALTSTTAMADDYLAAGLGAIYSPSPYIGVDTAVTAFPSIVYHSKHFRVEVTNANYIVNGADSPVEVFVGLGFDTRFLKPSDSDNVEMQKLDKRNTALFGGAGIRMNLRRGFLEAKAATDISNTHNGHYFEAKFAMPLGNGPIGFTPEIGYQINSKDLNNHLYGVSASEASRTDFDEFEMGYEGQYFVGGSGYMYVSQNISIVGYIRYVSLEDNIKSSPIVSDSDTLSGMVGLNFTF